MIVRGATHFFRLSQSMLIQSSELPLTIVSTIRFDNFRSSPDKMVIFTPKKPIIYDFIVQIVTVSHYDWLKSVSSDIHLKSFIQRQ